MKQLRHLFDMILVAVFAACVLTGCGKASDDDDDEDEDSKSKSSSPTSAVVEKYWKAFEKYDLETMEECASEDSTDVVLSPREVEEFKKANLKFSLKKIEDEEVEDDEATVECLVEVSVGKKKMGKCHFTATLVKEKKKWLMAGLEPGDDSEELMEKVMKAVAENEDEDEEPPAKKGKASKAPAKKGKGKAKPRGLEDIDPDDFDLDDIDFDDDDIDFEDY